jgi:hypothetical protein
MQSVLIPFLRRLAGKCSEPRSRSRQIIRLTGVTVDFSIDIQAIARSTLEWSAIPLA